MKILTQYIPSILFMSGIYSIAIATLFFTYGKFIEKKVVGQNITYLLDNFMDKTFQVLSKSSKKDILDKIKNIDLSKFKKDDTNVDKQNNKIIIKAIKYISIFACIAISLSVFLWYFSKVSYKEYATDVLGKSMLFLFIIIIVEILFLTIISKNYKSIDPSVIKHYIVSTFQKKYGK
jgi:hypothetical protein